AAQRESVTLVFDASNAPADVPAEYDYHGIHITFAIQYERADDFIEDLIRRESAPRQLTVVSDDRRIQQAAGRRHCTVCGCSEYLNKLEQRRPQAARELPVKTSKPSEMSPEETKRWLGEFADLERDPAMRELTDLSRFSSDENFPKR